MKKICFITIFIFSVNCFAQERVVQTAKHYIENKCKISFDEVLYVSIVSIVRKYCNYIRKYCKYIRKYLSK